MLVVSTMRNIDLGLKAANTGWPTFCKLVGQVCISKNRWRSEWNGSWIRTIVSRVV
jgi:hypothetical protein